MRNEKTITTSIGNVIVYELKGRHLRQLIKGYLKLDITEIKSLNDIIKPSNIINIYEFIDTMISELSTMSIEQFDELTITEQVDIIKAFIQCNFNFFLEKINKLTMDIAAMKTSIQSSAN